MGIHDPKTDIGPLVAAVASALGPEWSTTGQGAGYVLTDGTVALFARPDSFYGGRRVEISASYPHGSYNLLRYDEDSKAETSAALDRSPEAIARQIERKILADARKWTAILAERAEGRDQSRTRRQEFAATVAGILPGSSTDDEANTVRLHSGARPWYGDVRVRHDADGGSVELHGLTADQIVRVLKIAAES